MLSSILKKKLTTTDRSSFRYSTKLVKYAKSGGNWPYKHIANPK